MSDFEHVQTSSARTQLETWHAGRGSKSFLRACIPTWSHNAVYGPEEETKNPLKLLAMVGPMGWLYFFSGWFAWTCDGYDFFAVWVRTPVVLLSC